MGQSFITRSIARTHRVWQVANLLLPFTSIRILPINLNWIICYLQCACQLVGVDLLAPCYQQQSKSPTVLCQKLTFILFALHLWHHCLGSAIAQNICQYSWLLPRTCTLQVNKLQRSFIRKSACSLLKISLLRQPFLQFYKIIGHIDNTRRSIISSHSSIHLENLTPNCSNNCSLSLSLSLW